MQKIHDLTQLIEEGMPLFPGTPEVLINELTSVPKEGYLEHTISFSTHTGTHMDAPAHILENGRTLDSYGPEKFYGPAVVIDCEFRTEIHKEMVKPLYEESGNPDFILFYTGFSEYWGKKKYYNPFPVLKKEAADYLSTLPIKAVGIDALSFDPIDDSLLYNHHRLLSADILLIENLRGLKYLVNREFTFICLPLRIKGSDGSPVRAIAVT